MASPGDDDHQVPTLDGDVRKVFNLNPTNHKIPPMNVVAIGRPGVGKSTLLNGFMGRRIFKQVSPRMEDLSKMEMENTALNPSLS